MAREFQYRWGVLRTAISGYFTLLYPLTLLSRLRSRPKKQITQNKMAKHIQKANQNQQLTVRTAHTCLHRTVLIIFPLIFPTSLHRCCLGNGLHVFATSSRDEIKPRAGCIGHKKTFGDHSSMFYSLDVSPIAQWQNTKRNEHFCSINMTDTTPI